MRYSDFKIVETKRIREEFDANDPNSLRVGMDITSDMLPYLPDDNSRVEGGKLTQSQIDYMRQRMPGGTASGDPAVDAETDDAANASQGLEAGPPYPTEEMSAVKELQARLEELAYSVGQTGIDGKYGPRTTRAVAAYKKDNNISTGGDSMSAAELAQIKTAKKVDKPSPTGNGREINPKTGQRGPDRGSNYKPDFSSVDMQDARKVAEAFLGRTVSDTEWDLLLRATAAEADNNSVEMASCMGVMLNRMRSPSYPDSARAVLYQRNQFEAVTGHGGSGSRWFRNPGQAKIDAVVADVIKNLPSVNTSWLNFTSNNPAAYSSSNGLRFRDRMLASRGSQVIGGTIFGTV